MKRIAYLLLPLYVPAAIIILWIAATHLGWVSTLVLPYLSDVGNAIVTEFQSGELTQDILVSLSRIAKGYGLAVAGGLLLGVLMGMFEPVSRMLSPTVSAIRQVPVIAWVPLLIIWFGIGEASKVAVIFLASYFPIMVNTTSGIQRTDRRLVEVGEMYRLNKWQLFRQIYLPSALPSVFVGLKLGLSISWMAVVGAEMIAASSGIGFRINDARTLLQYPVVFCGILSIALVGAGMDFLITWISRLALPWEQKKR